jgi:di/tricarboxylate transporter
MTFDILLVFGILTVVIILFISDRLRLDLVAIIAVLALILTGLLTPREALAGFSDPVVIIIAGLFVVGAGLFETGVAGSLGKWLGRVAGTRESTLIVVIMLVVAILSAFISSTGTVAIFLPVVVSLAANAGISPSRLLIPLAYGSLLGGMLTLIGTPPNIIVSNHLAGQGREPFHFFAFMPVGLTMLTVSMIFMLLIGRRLLPKRRSSGADAVRNGTAYGSQNLSIRELAEIYGLTKTFFQLRVQRQSPMISQSLGQLSIRSLYGVNMLAVGEGSNQNKTLSRARPVTADTVFHTHDILYVQGNPVQVKHLAQTLQLDMLPTHKSDERRLTEEQGIVEVLLTPRSRLIGKTITQTRFRDTYNINVLAIMRFGKAIQSSISTVPLEFGDTLLVGGAWDRIDALCEDQQDFVVISQPREMPERRTRKERAPHALVILLGMLVLMTTGLTPTVTAVLLAAVAMVLTGCVTMEETYRTMNWESIILIAGMLPMATALEQTGGVELIATVLTDNFGAWGPLAVMAGLFTLTSAFSQFISNTATTVLMAPIAFQAALKLDADPVTFLMTVAVAASTAFATPIASPVNALVLGPGGYRFADFALIGVPLQLLLLVTTLFVVPFFFPFG